MLPTDPLSIARALIRCESVTPAEGGALAYLEALLGEHGFACQRPVFSQAGTPDVENLYARVGDSAPVLAFAGHADVVPPGDTAAWRHPPFAAEIEGDTLYGRGAVDMKGAIACFASAAIAHLGETGTPRGSIVFLITGDEEGPSINGTRKLLAWAHDRGERFDAALVGEPTNPAALGDAIKVGRRGSLSATVTVSGVQGHVAYPHLARNPVPGILAVAAALTAAPLDEGTDRFQPSNLEITSIDVGNPAHNLIPARARLACNVRFNDLHTPDSLRAALAAKVDGALAGSGLSGDIVFEPNPAEAFLTDAPALINAMRAAVEAETGATPELTTGGGTSDARYIKDYCPVIEFGLVGQTMHQVDERVVTADLTRLTAIYRRFLASSLG